MTLPLLIGFDGNDELKASLVRRLRLESGDYQYRRFPDGESYVRLISDCRDRDLILLGSLNNPDERTLPLWFLADTARELGARSVGLVSPYLAYMRQDKRFHPGESLNARLYGRYLSQHVDWLVTVDPHLHRIAQLSEVYAIPNRVVHAAPLLARYVRERVVDPVLVGPDSESEQWVSAVAADAGCPYLVLEKQRQGDREVTIAMPDMRQWQGRTPVLIDDIIASGQTLMVAVRQLLERGFRSPVCLAVHGLFADRSDETLAAAGAALVTSNSVVHASNAIDLGELLAPAITALCPPAQPRD